MKKLEYKKFTMSYHGKGTGRYCRSCHRRIEAGEDTYRILESNAELRRFLHYSRLSNKNRPIICSRCWKINKSQFEKWATEGWTTLEVD